MQVGIQTTQNVEINYEVAGVGERILAAMIDYLVIVGYCVAWIFFFAAAPSAFNGAIAIIAFLPVFFYDLIFEIFMEGQSIGKRQRQIKVVKLDGSQPDIGSYLLRWLVRLLEFLVMGGAIAIVTILFNRKGQRLGDMAAGTTVVKVRPRVTLEDTIFAAIDEDYTPVYPQATRMNEQDAVIIREALNADQRGHDGVAAALLYARAKEVLGISSEEPPITFLQTLLRDYNYYAGR